ncbi:CGNR zinc finger domain-containing protein [Salibacterium lacus]|uniref:CGNR zinc finger domain-containing protein n=1 Tax=Salibacterium lacus TaxID=1898109 RepID=A0ABW5T3L4_9BACI
MTDSTYYMEHLRRRGGDLSLDFVNTSNRKGAANQQEWLQRYDDFLDWAAYVGLTERWPDHKKVPRDDGEHDQALQRVLTVREAMYDVCTRAIAGKKDTESLDLLNEELKKANEHLILTQTDPGVFKQTYDTDQPDPDALLWPILHHFQAVLTEGKGARIKQCQNQYCDWLFLDVTKNKSRRWCSPDICGNRAKARRYYARLKTEEKQ